MKQYTPWMAWIAAVVIWWVAWVWGVFGIIQSKSVSLQAERNDLQVEEAQALGLLTTAPELVEKIDSIKNESRQVTSRFAATNDLQRLPQELADHGYQRGINEVEVTFDLASVLSIQAAPRPERNVLDTLLVQVSARGKFSAIGRWLDDLEQRADFLEWNSCRWQPSPQEGNTDFAGTAQFRIIAANADESASAD